MYSKRDWVTITISPPPYSGNNLFKFHTDLNYFRKVLRHTSKHFILVPEFDKMDRLHYHGVIRIDDKIKWYKSSKRKLELCGHTKIKLLTSFEDHLGWLLYIHKDWDINRGIFETRI